MSTPAAAYRRTLAGRLTWLTTCAVAVTVAVLTLGAYVTVRVQLTSTMDNALLERAQGVAQASAGSTPRTVLIPRWALGASDVRIAFVNADRRVRMTDHMEPLAIGDPEVQVAAGLEPHAIRTVTTDEGTRYRMVAVGLPSQPEAVVLAQSLAPQDRVLQRLGIVMLLFGLAGVLAAAVAGWAVTEGGLRPVRRLSAAAEHIARTEDLTPLPVEGDDEIAKLASSFNVMLAALAASRDRQRQLVADAGHELRTPLTSLRTNLDLLSQSDDPATAGQLTAEARAELISDVRGQIEEMTTLIGDLVELARDHAPGAVVGTVDLADVLDRALTRVRRRAPGVDFAVEADSWWLVGDSSALERAFTNVLDNAAKWSPAAATVRVRLADGVLTVDDEGPGIAAEDRPHVFERFYRSTRARSMPGSGLGLAIVRQVMDRHAGTVIAEESPTGRGTRVRLTLPGSSSPDQD
ncbi:HAMP domain-containing sensor histidine kinase [Nocardioides limicola]|uniref:HAMP domain-containing sensor histidine kinase n=1 Tax=Nocardioides limicola TaxID=2803368 RepID=UPI00193BCE1F|nr:HAMP domain-containing sensor histidine kinase [Nocardioides sp. DJM-14]